MKPSSLRQLVVRLVASGIALLGSACTDVADERAERDDLVGRYRDERTRIDVEQGLAVIRSVQGGSIRLWSSAPAWTASVRTPITKLSLEVRNLMPGSVLHATDERGAALAVHVVDTELPTRRTFTITKATELVNLELVPKGPDADAPYRFAVLSDIQNAITNVADVYARMVQEPDLAFVVSAGDLTSRGTREQLERFEFELENLPIPYYTTLGNHELGTDPPEYQNYFGRVNVHFHYRGAAFSLVDSGSATLAARTVDLLERWLDEDRSRVHVFATHYPPIDPIGVRNGSFASLAEAHQLIAKLAEGRVDLSLHGHVHSYYAFDMAGIPAYISGGGGAIPERFDGIGRHFLVVTLEPGRVQSVRVVRVDE